MPTLITGIIFLLAGALVYVFNTETHDPSKEITFSRTLGMEAIGPVETVAILIGLGMFFLGLGAFRWLTHQQLIEDDQGEQGEGSAPPTDNDS